MYGCDVQPLLDLVAHFTIRTNEQNQHFAELRQKVCLYIHVVVLLTCLPSLDGKLERFVKKNGKSGCQTRVRHTIKVFLYYSTIMAEQFTNDALLNKSS